VPFAQKERVVSTAIQSISGVTGKELWIKGIVDPVARNALAARGWKAQIRVEERLLNKVER
jgi:hypothetical protein